MKIALDRKGATIFEVAKYSDFKKALTLGCSVEGLYYYSPIDERWVLFDEIIAGQALTDFCVMKHWKAFLKAKERVGEEEALIARVVEGRKQITKIAAVKEINEILDFSKL